MQSKSQTGVCSRRQAGRILISGFVIADLYQEIATACKASLAMTRKVEAFGDGNSPRPTPKSTSRKVTTGAGRGGSDGSAACGRASDLSEWQGPMGDDAASAARRTSRVPTGSRRGRLEGGVQMNDSHHITIAFAVSASPMPILWSLSCRRKKVTRRRHVTS